MKNVYLLLSLLLIWNTGLANTFVPADQFSFNRFLANHVKRDQTKVLKHGIESCSQVVNVYRKDGSVQRSYIASKRNYNESGNLTAETEFTPSGKLLRSITYEYDVQQRLVTRIVKTKNLTGYSNYSWHFEYHNDSLISRVIGEVNGKKSWSYQYLYTEHNQVKEQRYYRKEKLSGRIEYDYYADLTKKEVRYYKDSLKLEKTFRYDCGIGPSLLSEKQKDTLTKCSRHEELPDGSTRTVEETRDEKGRIIRVIMTYHPVTGISKTEKYDANNRLLYSLLREPTENGAVRVSYTHFRKGKAKRELVQVEQIDPFGYYSWFIMEEDRVSRSYECTYTFREGGN